MSDPMTPDCARARGAFIDRELGQSAADESAFAASHLVACAACRREAAALAATIGLVRRDRLPEPSATFGAQLRARLDQAGPILELRPPLHSRRWLKVAAALVPLAIGGALWWRSAHVSDSDGTRPDLPTTADEMATQRDPSGAMNAPVARQDVPTAIDDDPIGTEPDFWIPGGHRSRTPIDRRALPDFSPDLGPIDPGKISRVGNGGAGNGGGSGDASAAANATRSPLGALPRALLWLGRSQREDGSWAPGRGEPGLDSGITALALLSLIADGGAVCSTLPPDEKGVLERTRQRAVSYLFAQQDRRDGEIRGGRDEAAQTFCHSVATLALVENYVREQALPGPRVPAVGDEFDRLEQALTRVEQSLRVLLDEPKRSRCAGQNAAWAALALATARHSGVDFHLQPTGESLAAAVLVRLKEEQPLLLMATSQAIEGLSERRDSPSDLAWSQAVREVLGDPAGVEPSLRFLVASALCAEQSTASAARRGAASETWANFAAAAKKGLLAQQSPSAGYFDSGLIWDCFSGGTVSDTALAVLSLEAEARQTSFAAARAKLERR